MSEDRMQNDPMPADRPAGDWTPVEVDEVDAGGFHWRLNRRHRADFTAMIQGPDQFLEAAAPRVIKSNSVRTVFFLRVGEHDYCVKRYQCGEMSEQLKARFIESRASREWRIMKAGREARLRVPVPAAVAERWRGRRLEASYLATLSIPDTLDLVPHIEAHLRDDTPARHAFMRALGAEVRRFHEAGLFHRDLHGGNVLVQRGADGAPVLHFIDLHRGSLRRQLGRRARRWNLAFLLHSTAQVSDARDRRAAVEGYDGAGAAPVFGDVDAVQEWIERRIGRFERRRLKSRTQRCLLNSSAFRVESDEVGSLYRDRTFDAEAARTVVAAIERGEGEVLKNTRRTRVRALAGPDGQALVAKVFLPKAYERLGGGRGLRAWRAGHGLLVRGVPAARPLAFHAPKTGGGILIMARAEGVRLDQYVIDTAERRGERSRAFRAEIERTSAAVAELFIAMHRGGAYHGDMKACNICVSGDGEMPRQLTVIDYDAVRFPDRPLDERRRTKNLAQLHASLPVHVNRSARCRWFRRYATPEAYRARRQTYAEVARICADKNMVGRELFE